MLKVSKNLVLALFIIISIVFMIIETKEVMLAVNTGVLLWATRVFPVLFPFYIVTSIALTYGVAHLIGDLLKPVTKFLFNTSPISGFVFFMSLLSGNPSSAYIISQLYENNDLSKEEAQHLLNFCVFVNPLFCLGAVGYSYFHNSSIGYIVLLAHISANIVIGILLRFKRGKQEPLQFSFKSSYQLYELQKSRNKLNFGENITEIIQKGMSIMFLIGGFMIFYNILIVILKSTKVIFYSYHSLSYIYQFFHISYNTYYAFFIGLCEMVIGVDQVTKSNFDLRITITIITMLISFGGLSIHSQIQSLLLKVKLKYYPFLLARISQMIISGIIAYTIFPLLYKENARQTFAPIYYRVEEKNILLITILTLISALFFIKFINNKKEVKPI